MFDSNEDNEEKWSDLQEKVDQVKTAKISKKDRVQEKRKIKVKTVLDKCDELILKQDYNEAISKLKQIILSNQVIPAEYTFTGAGNRQNWQGLCKDKWSQWYILARQQKLITKNPYDMLCICFVDQLQQNKMSSQQIIVWYEQALLKKPDCSQLYMGIGNIYYNSDFFVLAEKSYLKAQTFEKDLQKNYQYLAWIYDYWFQQQKKAQYYANKLLNKNPNSFYGYFIKGLINSDRERKVQLLLKCAEIKPQYYKAYVFLGQFSKDYQKKANYFQMCRKYNPTYPLLMLYQAHFQKLKGNIQQAIELYQKVLEIDPNQDYAYFQLGKINKQKRNYDQAIIHYELGLSINPRNIDICKQLGMVYNSVNNADKAIEYLQKCVQLNPYDYDSCNYIGLFYSQKKQNQTAKIFLKRTIEINPQFFEAYLNLASCEREDENYQLAIQNYNKTIELRPQYGDIYYGISICYWGLKKYQNTMEWGNKCIQKGCDEDHQVYEFLGDVNGQQLFYKQSLVWYLKSAKYHQQLKTQYIVDSIKKYNWDKTETIKVLTEMINDQLSFDKLFDYIQIGWLLKQLKKPDLAYLAFQRANELLNKNESGRQVQQLITNQLTNYNGSNNYWKAKKARGYGCNKDYFYLCKQKQFYKKIFVKLFDYKMEEEKQI